MSEIIRRERKKGDTAGLKMGTHKSRAGGLTQAGRDKVNRETGSNLKAPQPEGGARKKSFCARSRGWTGERGKLARKRWAC